MPQLRLRRRKTATTAPTCSHCDRDRALSTANVLGEPIAIGQYLVCERCKQLPRVPRDAQGLVLHQHEGFDAYMDPIIEADIHVGYRCAGAVGPVGDDGLRTHLSRSCGTEVRFEERATR